MAKTNLIKRLGNAQLLPSPLDHNDHKEYRYLVDHAVNLGRNQDLHLAKNSAAIPIRRQRTKHGARRVERITMLSGMRLVQAKDTLRIMTGNRTHSNRNTLLLVTPGPEPKISKTPRVVLVIAKMRRLGRVPHKVNSAQLQQESRLISHQRLSIGFFDGAGGEYNAEAVMRLASQNFGLIVLW